MTTKLRFALIGLAVFGGGFVLTGVALPLLEGGGGGSAQPASAGQLRWTIEDAKQFKEFPLYWLGESYEGLPLTTIIRHRFEPGPEMRPGMLGENIVVFIYGDCTPRPGQGGGCPVPLSVRVEPYCSRPPQLLADEAKQGHPLDVRGAWAQPIEGGTLMWAGDVRVSIHAVDATLLPMAAAALRGVALGGPRAGEPLPPPDPNSC